MLVVCVFIVLQILLFLECIIIKQFSEISMLCPPQEQSLTSCFDCLLCLH